MGAPGIGEEPQQNAWKSCLRPGILSNEDMALTLFSGPCLPRVRNFRSLAGQNCLHFLGKLGSHLYGGEKALFPWPGIDFG